MHLILIMVLTPLFLYLAFFVASKLSKRLNLWAGKNAIRRALVEIGFELSLSVCMLLVVYSLGDRDTSVAWIPDINLVLFAWIISALILAPGLLKLSKEIVNRISTGRDTKS